MYPLLFLFLFLSFTEPPDFQDALIMRAGATVESICRTLHRDLVNQFKYANVWVCRGKKREDQEGKGSREEEQ
jgi:uncharacterized protein